MHECDGCGKIGSESELEEHIQTNMRKSDGKIKEPEDITCWGYMLVGGKAWQRMQTRGEHPMNEIIQNVRKIFEDDEE